MDVPNVTLVDSWADEEFGDVDLGDKRLDRRLLELARVIGQRPSASLPQALQDKALLKAAYRLFDHDDDDFTGADMIAAHVRATYDRCTALPLVLAVSDTTLLDFSAHPDTKDLGPLAYASQQGLVLHSTLAFSPAGVPLGILSLQIWARDPDTFGHKPDHHTRSIEQKESYKWMDGLLAVNLAADAVPTATFVFAADAEAASYDLFVAERKGNVELLIRAAQDRCVDHPDSRLWAALKTAPIAGTISVRVAAKAAVEARYSKPARPAQAARTATVQVRYAPITLKVPRKRKNEDLKDMQMWAVWAGEIEAPAGAEAIEWMLLTTVAVSDAAKALEVLAWYCCRWGVEVWHKALKSGCKIEAKQLGTGERLKRCVALFGVIAWRIVYATMLCRAMPDVPCTALLSDDEWEALYIVTHRTTHPPAEPPTLREAVGWLARLGGFLGRAGDGDPGITVLWRGFQELAAHTTMYQIFKKDRQAIPVHSRKNQHVGKG
jgi:hypothetical protein